MCACAYAQIINDMARQEIWIRLQDDLNRAYSVLRSLIDNEGRVSGLDMDSCRLLFRRISEIKDNKSLQIEFDDLPDNEKHGRAKKMLDCLMQYHLCGGRVEDYDSDRELAKMRQYAKKVNSLDTEMQKWEKDFSRLIYDVEMFIIEYCQQEGKNTKKTRTQKKDKNTDFRNCIQCKDKEKLIERLHELIDGKQGCDVGYVLLKCRIDGLITRNPKEEEMKSEFPSVNYNSSVKNYLTEDSLSDNGKVARAGQIVIFDN